jgi:hypothetical protein
MFALLLLVLLCSTASTSAFLQRESASIKLLCRLHFADGFSNDAQVSRLVAQIQELPLCRPGFRLWGWQEPHQGHGFNDLEDMIMQVSGRIKALHVQREVEKKARELEIERVKEQARVLKIQAEVLKKQAEEKRFAEKEKESAYQFLLNLLIVSGGMNLVFILYFLSDKLGRLIRFLGAFTVQVWTQIKSFTKSVSQFLAQKLGRLIKFLETFLVQVWTWIKSLKKRPVEEPLQKLSLQKF